MISLWSEGVSQEYHKINIDKTTLLSPGMHLKPHGNGDSRKTTTPALKVKSMN